MTTTKLRRGLLPLAVFVSVGLLHFGWATVFPERAPVQERWATVEPSALVRYIDSQGYWLAFSYAIALAFAATAFRRYREERFCAARTLAIGGVTLSGFIAVAGCYLLGCCGSPMLAVYMSLFGARVLPFTKPLVAAMTVLSIAVAWWWMNHYAPASAAAPCDATCGCEEEPRAAGGTSG